MLVQAHHDALHVAALGEDLVDLLLAREEGQVAYVERGGRAQRALPVGLQYEGAPRKGQAVWLFTGGQKRAYVCSEHSQLACVGLV